MLQSIILNGARSGDLKVDEVAEVLAFRLQGLGQVVAFRLRDLKIADCVGCFGCWVKTPGECVISDVQRDVVRGLAHADLRVYVTPIVFGGYSYELKKALDRQIGNLLPFFKKYETEVHHPLRYGSKPSLVALGVLPKPDGESEEIFGTLVSRNAINMHAKAYAAVVVYLSDAANEVQKKVGDVLVQVGVNGAV